jgi:hypothetical protein
MWRRVDLVWTDVSEERIASIFCVEKSAREEPVWVGGCRLSHQSSILAVFDWWLSLQSAAHTGSSLADFSDLKMEAIRSSETSVHTRSARHHIPEDGILHSHRSENLKSCTENNPVSEVSCSARYWTMNKVQRLSSPESNTPSSAVFHLPLVSFECQ